MDAFNARDKIIIQRLLDARNSGVLSLRDFMEQFYFNSASKRALILQAKGHYAVFFLAPALFDNIDTRNTEIQEFFDLLSLLQELKKQGYLINYRTKAESIYFFQQNFANPKPQKNTIILNDQGDYTSSPDSIHDRNKNIIFKGTYFHGDLFDFILNNTTGMMIVSKKLEELVERQSESENKRQSESDSEHEDMDMNESGKRNDAQLAKINLIISSAMFVFIIVFAYFFYGFCKTEKEVSIFPSGKDSTGLNRSATDSSVKTANLSIPITEKDSGVWRGVDISKWNGNAAADIDPGDSITFIICKATEGLQEVDPDFDSNWQIIRDKAYILGAYHFYITNEDPVKQAQHFLSTIQSKGKTDMVPIVDIEHESIPAGELVDNLTLQKNLLQFLSFVESQCNCTPMIYTNGGFANEFLLNRVFNKYPLWLAAYTNSPTPPIPYAWRESGYKIWQKRNSYQLNTHVFDFDVFYGKKTDLYK